MKKFLIPATLLIASTLGGAAFAGSMPQAASDSLYGQPNPFAAVQTPATEHLAYVDTGSQQASLVYTSQGAWAPQAPAAGESHHDPE